MGKVIKVRFGYGKAFLSLGSILFVLISWGLRFEILSFTKVHRRQLLWCIAWSLAGMGAGLINSRDKGSKRHRKYLVYFLLFVFPIAILSALLAGLLVPDNHVAFFYLSSMLVAIGIGFSGDSLAGKLHELIRK